MTIDIFTHALPKKLYESLQKKILPHFLADLTREAQTPGLTSLDERFKLMDKNPDIRQVVAVSGPFLEAALAPEDQEDLAGISNDETAELVRKYPDRFIAGVANLPWNNIEATLRELDRAVRVLKLRGIQIGTDINGKPLDTPEFMPVYEKMEEYGLPIWIHPSKNQWTPDYPAEGESKYGLFMTAGWPHSTTMAMLRLVFSGTLEKFPGLKLVTHHAGGTVPYLIKRIAGIAPSTLPHPVTEYLKRFYTDTAVQGNTANLICAQALFGSEHLLFGSDFPYGPPVSVTLRGIEEMNLPAGEKQMILEDNAMKLLNPGK